jgi:hypothetical protein
MRKIYGHADRLGKDHVWLRCRGGQAKRDAHLQGVAQTIDRGEELRRDGMAQKTEQRR